MLEKCQGDIFYGKFHNNMHKLTRGIKFDGVYAMDIEADRMIIRDFAMDVCQAVVLFEWILNAKKASLFDTASSELE